MSTVIAPLPRLSEGGTLQLLATLEDLFQGHQNLLALLQDEKCFIVEGKIEALLSCVAEKETLMKRIAALEKKRLGIMAGLDEINSTHTLKTLIPRVAPIYREKLKTLGGQLDVLTSSITEVNQINGILVERVLGQISDLFILLRHLTPDGNTYQESGKMSRAVAGRTISRG